MSIGSYDSFMEALGTRHDFFHEVGCRASDHGLDRIFASEYTAGEAQAIFNKARTRRPLTEEEIDKLRSAMLHDFAVMDHARGWVQQFHLGAARNNSSRAVRSLGPDTGYDSIGDLPQGATLVRFLDRLDAAGCLAKTILYNLNPADNEVLASVIGSFQDGSAPGKMQFGSAWWFLDQARRHGEADERALQPGPAGPLRGHAHRLAQLPVLFAARVFSAPAVRDAGPRRRAGRWSPTTWACSASWSRTSASATPANTSPFTCRAPQARARPADVPG